MRLVPAALVLAFAGCLLLARGPALRAQQPTAEANDQTLARAAQLIEQLGSHQYAQRESAARTLAELGEAARPALEAALRVPQAETRLRVLRILELIDQGDFERAIESLLADAAGQADHDLPGWKRYRELIGRDLAGRQLFADMVRAESELLVAVDEGKRAAASQLQIRCQQLQVESTAEQREIPPGSLAAVLFVASDEQLPELPGIDALLYRFCNHSSMEDALVNLDQPVPMQRLVRKWIASGRAGYSGLRLAMEHELPEGLIAADIMLSSDAPAYYKQYAILAYARLGSREDLPRLEKMLDDETVCTTHRVNDVEYQTQFRDIALAVVLHLYGQDPKTFGFDRVARHSQYVFSSYSLGFENDAQRQEAFAKWQAFRREQTPAPPPKQ